MLKATLNFSKMSNKDVSIGIIINNVMSFTHLKKDINDDICDVMN